VGSLRGKQARTNLAAAGHDGAGVQGSRGARNTGFSGGANVQEFQTFYQENLGLIYRYVYGKVGNREEAEDLTSQIFMKAVRGVDTERGPQSMQKWLFQVARTTIADYWRAHYRVSVNSLEELLDAGWEGPVDEEPAAMNGKPEDRVHRILQALPEHYREVLTCRFLLNLSIRDTAIHMNLTEANVKVLQFRALKRAADLEHIIIGTR
jgi:RNA polymerase sigma-70 factor (ECF subfamily)